MAYIALIMTIIKILLDLTIFIVKKINQRTSQTLNSEGVSCKYFHRKSEKNVCAHTVFKKNLKNDICPRERCKGFNTGKAVVNDNTEIINSPQLLILKKIIDLFPEFAAALLALNAILMN